MAPMSSRNSPGSRRASSFSACRGSSRCPSPRSRSGLVVFFSYRFVERVLFVLVLAFLAYPISVFILRPDWPVVLSGFIPSIPTSPSALVFALALVGTTITPYLLFYMQASVVDKGVDRQAAAYARGDVFLGAALAGLFAFFIIVVTGSVLHPAGL